MALVASTRVPSRFVVVLTFHDKPELTSSPSRVTGRGEGWWPKCQGLHSRDED